MILLKALYDLAEKHEENSIMDDINDYLKNRNQSYCEYEKYELSISKEEFVQKQYDICKLYYGFET